ncbi:MAG: hypothetical protein QM628_00240 [Propionicimonas sp.]
MAADYTWLLNGVDLDEASLGLASVTLWRPPISVRRSPVEVTGRHGSISSKRPPVFTEPQLVIGFRADQASQAALEAAITKLAALLAAADLTVTRISGGVSTSAPAELVSADMDAGFVPGGFAAPLAILAVPTVFLRQPSDVGGPLPFNANLTAAALPHLAGSSAPITDAIVRLKGPHAGLFTITDAATGTGLSQSAASLTGSQYLYVDAGRFRSWISASDSAWTGVGTDVSANLDYPAAGILQLWPVVEPAVGDSSFAAASAPTVRISATGGTGRTGDTTLAVYAGRSFL